jgi:CRP-like cAMP-binding protein
MRHDPLQPILDHLAAQPLFSTSTPRELRAVANLGTTIAVRDGAVLTRQGALGREFCVLTAGHALCLIDDRPVAVFGAGDFFGEMALLDGGRRQATVIAQGCAQVLVLDVREFRQLLDSSPSVAAKITAACSTRRHANEHFRITVEPVSA